MPDSQGSGEGNHRLVDRQKMRRGKQKEKHEEESCNMQREFDAEGPGKMTQT